MNTKKGLHRVRVTLSRVLPVLILALCAALFFLYALGYYDFTFVERPQVLDGSPEKDDTATVTEPPAVEPPVTEPPVTGPPVTEPPVTEPPVTEPEIDPSKFPSFDEASLEGYYLTSLPFGEGMIIAENRLRLECTDRLHMQTDYNGDGILEDRVRVWESPHYVYESQYSSAELVWQLTEEKIPALEAYMGYIFADNGQSVYIYDAYGRHIGYFDPGTYAFAYKRDRLGNPLFVNRYPQHITVSTEDGEQSADFHSFSYYYLGKDGGIYESGYNDPTDTRGLRGDYPAYYGVFDSDFGRECTYSRVVQKTVKGTLESFIRTRWTVTWMDEPINDTVYYAAFPYSEGYACVADEEGTVFFIDTYGRQTFETKREYYDDSSSSTGRYVIERLLLPFDETTALGCYYFDHGLVMARRQVADKYQMEDWDVDWINSDEYVILRTDGSDFPIPQGYSVKNYSDGVILLEKGGTFGYMDYTGAWLGVPEYEDAMPFMEGLAPCKKNGRWGVIDTNGNTVIPFMYDYIQSPSSGIIICHSENGWNTYMKMAK